jgi:hypothetical protein
MPPQPLPTMHCKAEASQALYTRNIANSLWQNTHRRGALGSMRACRALTLRAKLAVPHARCYEPGTCGNSHNRMAVRHRLLMHTASHV